MLIRCVACNKLIYSDDALEDDTCPACGSTNTEHIAMGFVFDQTASVPDQPGKAAQQLDPPNMIHRKA
ncbi:hypothetical protein AWB82_03160 [Caballeronia glebae]|jgi:phage FluMu protein Com|uniref:Uncharacterized protein n=1 Tax=Caballeronia glebae TaxID=1777143 RepID=A0A158AXB8_9BURK|nr:hypothetical protein AWB82_03160 [Caballeronia glebae]